MTHAASHFHLHRTNQPRYGGAALALALGLGVAAAAGPAAASCSAPPMTFSPDGGRTYATCTRACRVHNDNIGMVTFSGPMAYAARCLEECRRTPGCAAVNWVYRPVYSAEGDYRGQEVLCSLYGSGELSTNDYPSGYAYEQMNLCYLAPPPGQVAREWPTEIDPRLRQDQFRPNIPAGGSPLYRGK